MLSIIIATVITTIKNEKYLKNNSAFENISLYIFYCMPFMGFFGKSGNVWNNIMIAFLGIMASRFFFYISKSAMAEKMVKSPFVYTEGAEMFSKPNTLAVLSNIRINKSTVMTIPITLPLVMFIPQF